MRRDAHRTHREPHFGPPTGGVGCRGKRCYAGHDAAARVAKNMRRNHDSRVEGYRCIHCHWWHIGNTR